MSALYTGDESIGTGALVCVVIVSMVVSTITLVWVVILTVACVCDAQKRSRRTAGESRVNI